MNDPARPNAATDKTVQPTSEFVAPPERNRSRGPLDLLTDGMEVIAVAVFIVMIVATLLQVAEIGRAHV